MDGLNVFKGPESVNRYFDPDANPPLPLVEIPARLNPFREDGVRIYAKMLTALPAHNVKSLPALQMLRAQPQASQKSIVEASSGSTVLSLGILSHVLWGHDDVTAHVTNKKHPDSLRLLRFFGLKVSLYGGLAQQEPTDSRGIMNRLRQRAAADDSIVYPGQYDNENNWKAHQTWTGPQILRQLPDINIFCTTVGTGGCITGTGLYLKTEKPAVRVVGVFNVFGDPTPGPRHFHGFHTCGFPWKDSVDAQVEVSSADAYRMSMKLSREGLIAGPSSGEALHGLLSYLSSVKAAGGLSGLADPTTGEVSCVFTCSDLPYQYIDGYFSKLAEDEFPPIHNEVLLSCDQDRHDERWVLDPADALVRLSDSPVTKLESSDTDESGDGSTSGARLITRNPSRWGKLSRWAKSCFSGTSQEPNHSTHAPETLAQTVVIDLRGRNSFQKQHFPGSIMLIGGGPELPRGDLFGNADSVHTAWTRLRDLFDSPTVAGLLANYRKANTTLMVVDHDGSAACIATALLRARDIEAFSIKGGFAGLQTELKGAQ
ncbi:cysteine synthase [Plectosphaerella plurivora]|uniref:Cysteine synthase n=1 Tax=Plectosphaerella plurivora TaxID=936078 RepID=A0A9P8VA23_9PEZI|nr:cysteine synthase [Plectosphaerella plurivora]